MYVCDRCCSNKYEFDKKIPYGCDVVLRVALMYHRSLVPRMMLMKAYVFV